MILRLQIIGLLSLLFSVTIIGQELKSPYPIIFIHGITSNYQTWSVEGPDNDLLDYLTDAGLVDGGHINVCLDNTGSAGTLMNSKEEDVQLKTLVPDVGDFYTLNFDVHSTGIVPSEINDFPNEPPIFAFDLTISAVLIPLAGENSPLPLESFNIGDILRIDDEFMLVEGLDGYYSEDIKLNGTVDNNEDLLIYWVPNFGLSSQVPEGGGGANPLGKPIRIDDKNQAIKE